MVTKDWTGVSASQLKTFSACKRQWIFESLLGHRSPPTPAQALGTAIHSCLERWQETAIKPQRRAIANDDPDANVAEHLASQVMPVAFLLPAPLTAEVEVSIHERYAVYFAGGKVLLRGYVDLLHGEDIYDYKTTSSPRYIKSVEQLREDIQLVVYAGWLLRYIRATPGCGLNENKITVSHVYIPTKGEYQAAVIRKVPMPVPHIEEQWALIEAFVQEMHETASGGAGISAYPKADDSVCRQYGGCHLKATCHAIPFNVNQEPPMPLPPPPSNSAAALQARLRAMQGQVPEPAPVVPPDAPRAAPPAAPRSAPPAPTAPPAPSRPVQSAPPAAPRVVPPAPPAPPAAPPQRRPRGYEAKMSALGWPTADIENVTIASCKRIVNDNLSYAAWRLDAQGDLVEYVAPPVEDTQAAPAENNSEVVDELIRLGYPISEDWSIDNIYPPLVSRIVREQIEADSLADDWGGGFEESNKVMFLFRKDGSKILPDPVQTVKVVEQPVVTNPVVVEQPVVTKPVVVEQPVVTKPVVVEQPVVTKPVVVEQPVVTKPVERNEKGYALFINCCVQDNQRDPLHATVSADTLLADAIRTVEEGTGMPWQMGRFGGSEERGRIVALVRKAITVLCEQNPDTLHHLMLYTNTGNLGADLVAGLRPFAKIVVQGMGV